MLRFIPEMRDLCDRLSCIPLRTDVAKRSKCPENSAKFDIFFQITDFRRLPWVQFDWMWLAVIMFQIETDVNVKPAFEDRKLAKWRIIFEKVDCRSD
jgi:hypothetical protein